MHQTFDTWIKSDQAQQFDLNRLKIIKKAYDANLDWTILTNPKYNLKQMHEIWITMLYNNDPQPLCNPKLSDQQMRILRKGIEEGFDMSCYNDPNIDEAQLFQIFSNMMKHKKEKPTMHQTFEILISERRSRLIPVEATSLEEAIAIVRNRYQQLDIALTEDDFAEVIIEEG